MRDFRELEVWIRSMEVAHACYRASDEFPNEERFGLTRQLRRAAVSVPSNIAEGSGRESPKDFVRFLRIAYGSACELETQILVAHRLEFGPFDRLDRIAKDTDEVRRMLHGLIRRITKDNATSKRQQSKPDAGRC